jgi:predicted negative regulator of RcsB-dependent stress response
MSNILKGILIGLIGGLILGWMLAEDKQRRQQQAASDAYANDPELVAIRKERKLEKQMNAILDSMEDDYDG